MLLCLDPVMILNLCSGEQMNRWMTMKNLMLEDTGTQCFDRRLCLSREYFIIYLDKFEYDVEENECEPFSPLKDL